MFWTPYILQIESNYSAHLSVDPAYDSQIYLTKGQDCRLWTLTYPLPLSYAWELLRLIKGELGVGLRWWRLVWRLKRQLREWGLPPQVRPCLCKPEYSLEPASGLDLSGIMGSRLLTDREIIQEVSGKPLPWPGFEVGIQELLFRGELEAIPGIVFTTGGQPRCSRCGSFEIIQAPCTRCGYTECFACQSCAELGVVRGCTSLFRGTRSSRIKVSRLPAPSSNFELTQAQQRLLVEMKAFWHSKDSTCLVDAVCGAGKGYIVLKFLKELLIEGQGEPVLFTTPRQSVIEEWADEYLQVLGAENVSILYGGRHEYRPEGVLTMATLPQLYRFTNAFKLAIIDEADAFPLGSNPHFWMVLSKALQPGSKKLLFTATPQELIQFASAPTLRLPARYHGQRLPVPEVISLNSEDAFYSRTLELISRWEEQKDIRIFVFVPTKIIQKEVLSQFTKNGYTGKIVCFYSGMSDFPRKLADFRQGQIRIAISTILLERGITISPCAVLVFKAGHRNFSTASLVQMAGRAGRSANDPSGEVVYLVEGNLSPQAKKAIEHIKSENYEALRKGYLNGDRDQACSDISGITT